MKDNNIELYSTYNEGKSVVAERFIKGLKNRIFKHMTAVSKNLYFDVLDDAVDKYNNTFHGTIKMKPIDVKSDSYAEYNVDSNEKDPKFKVDDHVRILKYINILVMLQIGQKKSLLLAKFKILFHGHLLLVILMVKNMLELFMKKKCKILIKNKLE